MACCGRGGSSSPRGTVAANGTMRLAPLVDTQGTIQLYYHGNGRIVVNGPSGARYLPRNRILTIYKADREYVEGLVGVDGNQLFSTTLPANPEQRILGTMPMIDAIATSFNPAVQPAFVAPVIPEQSSVTPVTEQAVVTPVALPVLPVEPVEPFDFTILNGVGPAKNRLLHDALIYTPAQFIAMDTAELAEWVGTNPASVEQWKEDLAAL